MIEMITNVNNTINGIVWGCPSLRMCRQSRRKTYKSGIKKID